MGASLKPPPLDEFLAWERTQPVRYEFDGTQPVAMTGGTIAADRVARRLLRALERRLKPPCEAFGENVKVLTPAGRVRYPDVKVACGEFDHVDPVVVFEVLSPTTEMTDRRVKSAEYASIPGVMAYVPLAQGRPAATVLRCATGQEPEDIEGIEAALDLPEIGAAFRLAEPQRDARKQGRTNRHGATPIGEGGMKARTHGRKAQPLG